MTELPQSVCEEFDTLLPGRAAGSAETTKGAGTLMVNDCVDARARPVAVSLVRRTLDAYHSPNTRLLAKRIELLAFYVCCERPTNSD